MLIVPKICDVSVGYNYGEFSKYNEEYNPIFTVTDCIHFSITAELISMRKGVYLLHSYVSGALYLSTAPCFSIG